MMEALVLFAFLGVLSIIVALVVATGNKADTDEPNTRCPQATTVPKSPRFTQWDIKKSRGGVHSWVVNGEVDPDYIKEVDSSEDHEPIEIDEKPY